MGRVHEVARVKLLLREVIGLELIGRKKMIKELNELDLLTGQCENEYYYVRKRLFDLYEERDKIIKELNNLNLLNKIRFQEVIDYSIISNVSTYVDKNLNLIEKRLRKNLPIENNLYFPIENLRKYLSRSLFLQICEECNLKSEDHTALFDLCTRLSLSIVLVIKVVPSNGSYNIVPTYKVINREEFNYCVDFTRNIVENI